MTVLEIIQAVFLVTGLAAYVVVLGVIIWALSNDHMEGDR